jgi:hypothetical protein
MGARKNAFVRNTLIDAKDVDIPICVRNANEAIAIIRDHRERWAAVNGPQAHARPAAG